MHEMDTCPLCFAADRSTGCIEFEGTGKSGSVKAEFYTSDWCTVESGCIESEGTGKSRSVKPEFYTSDWCNT